MINDYIQNILNEQINKEFYSAYLYLAISAYFDEIGLKGFSSWTKVQAREEVDHGMIIFNHIIDRDGEVELKQINAPDISLGTPLEIFKTILEHEKSVTASIDSITADSDNQCDFATRNFINWYVGEQVEEESQVRDIIDKLEIFGEVKSALYNIDAQLAMREYQPHKM